MLYPATAVLLYIKYIANTPVIIVIEPAIFRGVMTRSESLIREPVSAAVVYTLSTLDNPPTEDNVLKVLDEERKVTMRQSDGGRNGEFARQDPLRHTSCHLICRLKIHQQG